MARVTLGSGETITIGGTTSIIGTSGEQTINILDGSTINFLGGFNSGERDTIRLNGNASDFVVSAVGLTVTLFSAVDNIRIVLPIGSNGADIVFDNGDTRTITREGNGTKIDDQLITGTPVALSEGPGVYEVTSSGEVLEGGVIVFTVTRTDTSVAETLNATVLGSTNDGTVNAATLGDDFAVAGQQLTFAVGQATATFTVSAQNDNLTEGLEGIVVRVLNSDAEVVATTTGLIVDQTPLGQTFQLTPGLDTVGTGAATDLTGSNGNNETDGNDTIVALTGEVNLLNPNLGLTGTLTPFDNINGGAGDDTLLVLDNGNTFTSAPNFTGVTVDNVENLDYRAPTRGFLNGSFNANTAGFDGLENASFFINGGGDQTITLDDVTTSTPADGSDPVNTSAVVTQIGNGDLFINGGGDTLDVTAAEGDVTVGDTAASNSFTDVAITGGQRIEVNDQGEGQELTTVDLDGFGGNFFLTGEEIADVSISDLDAIDGNNNRNGVITTETAVAVALSDIDVNNFDITATGPELTIDADGESIDISAGSDFTAADGNLVINSLNGEFSFGDAVANGDDGVVTLNAAPGSLDVDQVFGADLNSVNITGSGSVEIFDIAEDDDDEGTVITSTNSGGVTVESQLGDNTKFAGSLSSGDDNLIFGATDRANSFGAGDDIVTFNADTFVDDADDDGDEGAFDGGADYDILRMESNNANTFTADEQAVSNFEELVLTNQVIGKADVIDLHNIGMDTISNVTSNVGNTAPQTEEVTISFAGVASGPGGEGNADSVTFDGVTVDFSDGDDAAAMAEAFVAQYGAGPNWTAALGVGGDTVVLTANASGSVADLDAGDFVFIDAFSPGTPTISLTDRGTQTEGVDAVASEAEVVRLNLTGSSINNNATFTLTDVDSATVFTFDPPVGLSFANGELATVIALQANDDPVFSAIWTATVDGDDVIFTSVNEEASNGLTYTAGLNGGIQGAPDPILTTVNEGVDEVVAVQEQLFFAIVGTVSGQDTLVLPNGESVTFTGAEVTSEDFAVTFRNEYNMIVGRDFSAIPFFPGDVDLVRVEAGDFDSVAFINGITFIDDLSIGTPTVDVDVTNQGSTSSVTLDNFISGSRLTLTNTNGNHTVNMKTDNNANVLNLVLAVDGGDHGVVTADDAETVNIDTGADLNPVGSDTLDLLGGDLTTLVITGQNGLDLNTDSTIISSIDATGLTGFFEWAADANSVNITVSTGSGGSDVDFSGVLLGGGQAAGSSGRITFIGGSGDDRIVTGGDSTARGTITTGDGDDIVVVGTVDGGNDFWSIVDFDAEFDKLDFVFGETGIVVELDQELEDLTAVFQDYLDQAARGDGDGTIRYFYFNGDTYVVQDNADGEDFVDGEDAVIRIEGEVELTAENFI